MAVEKQGSVTRTDLKLNWRINDAMNVQAFVDNASNTPVINRFVWGGGSTIQISAAAPRTFGVTWAINCEVRVDADGAWH